MKKEELLEVLVAPFAGAWIEIENLCQRQLQHSVAPFAGAWIEIHYLASGLTGLIRHSLCGSVD